MEGGMDEERWMEEEPQTYEEPQMDEERPLNEEPRLDEERPLDEEPRVDEERPVEVGMDKERPMYEQKRQMGDAMDESGPDILDVFSDLGVYLRYDNLLINPPPMDNPSENDESLRKKLEWIHLLNTPSFIPRYSMVMARLYTNSDIRVWFQDLVTHKVPMFLHEPVFYSTVLRSMIELGIDYRGTIVDLMDDKESAVELDEMFPAYRLHIENKEIGSEGKGYCTFSRSWVFENKKAFKILAQDYNYVVNRAERLTAHEWLEEECLKTPIKDAVPTLLFPLNKHGKTVTFAGILALLRFARRLGYRDSKPSWRHRVPYCEAQICEAVEEYDFEEEPRNLNPHWILDEIRMGALPVDLLPTVYEANVPLDYQTIARMQVKATGQL